MHLIGFLLSAPLAAPASSVAIRVGAAAVAGLAAGWLAGRSWFRKGTNAAGNGSIPTVLVNRSTNANISLQADYVQRGYTLRVYCGPYDAQTNRPTQPPTDTVFPEATVSNGVMLGPFNCARVEIVDWQKARIVRTYAGRCGTVGDIGNTSKKVWFDFYLATGEKLFRAGVELIEAYQYGVGSETIGSGVREITNIRTFISGVATSHPQPVEAPAASPIATRSPVHLPRKRPLAPPKTLPFYTPRPVRMPPPLKDPVPVPAPAPPAPAPQPLPPPPVPDIKKPVRPAAPPIERIEPLQWGKPQTGEPPQPAPAPIPTPLGEVKPITPPAPTLEGLSVKVATMNVEILRMMEWMRDNNPGRGDDDGETPPIFVGETTYQVVPFAEDISPPVVVEVPSSTDATTAVVDRLDALARLIEGEHSLTRRIGRRQAEGTPFTLRWVGD